MKFLCLFLFPALLLAANPGITVGITEGSLVSAFSLFEEYANSKLSNLPIGDFELDYETVSMSFSSVYSGSNVDIQISDMIFAAPGSINIYLASFTSLFNFDLEATYSTQTFTGTGNMTVSSEDISFTVSILNNHGAPKINVQNLSIVLNNVTLSTSLPAFQNTEIMNYMNGNLQSLESRLTQYIYNEINQLNAVLADLPSKYPLAYWDVWVQMNLVGDSLLESDYFVLPLMGQVLDGDLDPVIPFTAGIMSPMQSGEDFQVQFSDYFLGALGTAIWEGYDGVISSWPAGLPIQLTTTGLKGLVPKLVHKYGKNKPVSLQVSMSDLWPQVTVQTCHSANVTFGMLTQVFVETTGGNPVEAIDINTLFDVNFNFTVKSQTGSMAVNYIKPLENVVTYSTVGKISSKTLNKEMKKIIAGSMTTINDLVKSFKTNIPMIDYFFVTADSITVMNGTTVFQANLTPN